MSKNKQYTMPEIRRIATDWAANVPMSAICEKYDRSASGIFYIMNRNRDMFPSRNKERAPRKINRKELSEMIKNGTPVAKIAMHFGAREVSVYSALKSMRTSQDNRILTTTRAKWKTRALEAEAAIASLSEAMEGAKRAERHRIFRLLWDHSEHVNAYSLGLLIQDDASVTKALPPRDLSQGGQP